jgi:hypothetical protein
MTNDYRTRLFVICHLSFIIYHSSAPLQLPLAPGESSELTSLFAGEPLAEIRGFSAKPFEPDAGNAAEGSERWSCVSNDDDHTVLPKEPSDLR